MVWAHARWSGSR